MQEINAWLNGERDFNTGSELYAKYGDNSFFKKVLLNGPAPYTIKKLEAELESLAPAPPAHCDAFKIEIVSSAPDRHTGGQGNPVSNPDPKAMERYLSLKVLLKQTYRQIERNMTVLDISNDEPVLLQTANQILTLHDKIAEIFDLIDFFDEHNRFPDIVVDEEIVKTPEEQRQALYVSTSKAEKRLSSGSCKNQAKTIALIAANKKRIAELNERIKHERD